ncbi:hypothetical protein, partial [Phenylobacterium sp.]|uniref:hypothetical protein n=1 Tax=Phenylobacterium sp. TaxID=1871053 RepID=UPI0037CC37B3
MPSSTRPFLVTLAAAASFAGQVQAETAEAEVEAVVVTGSRLANASINGLEIETLRLPQNV